MDKISGEFFLGLCDVVIYLDDIDTSLQKLCKQLITPSDDLKKVEHFDWQCIFVKTDCLMFFQKSILPKLKNKFILFTHNSAYPIVAKYKRIANSPLLVRWYGQNMSYNHPKCIGLPLGLPNTMWEAVDFDFLMQHRDRNKTDLLYINYGLKTNPVRKVISDILLKKGFPTSPKKKWKDYVRAMSTHKFCVSPPGRGIDCHRIWECIYLGCIPIVLHDNALRHFTKLPILFVSDYSIITEEFLNKKYEQFWASNFDYTVLQQSYWKSIVADHKNKPISDSIIQKIYNAYYRTIIIGDIPNKAYRFLFNKELPGFLKKLY